MNLIQQKLAVKAWPLTKAGDEKFFGYVVALGVFPRRWDDQNAVTQYVDVAYNDDYERYQLPNDDALMERLIDVLRDNLSSGARAGGLPGKVWIFRDELGYRVELP